MKLKAGLLFLCMLFEITGTLDAQYNFNIIRTFSETNHEIVFASYNSDGAFIITAGTDSSIIIWNAEKKTIYRTLSGINGRPNAAVISPDNRYLCSGGRDNKVSVWDISSRPSSVIRTYEGFMGPVKSLDISPDGKYLAAGSVAGTVKIWDLENTNLVFDLKAQNKSKDINSVVFSPDSKILAAGGSDGTILLWNTSTGNLLQTQAGQKNGIQQIAISPDGKLLASCGYNNEIIIYQMPGLTGKAVLQGHRDWVQTIGFSPDSRYLISGGRDKYIILWDVATGKILHRSENQGGAVIAVAFDPSRPGFISANYKSTVMDEWALSGAEAAQWKRPQGTFMTAAGKPGGNLPDNRRETLQEPVPVIDKQAGQVSSTGSMIEIFSPVPVQDRVTHEKNSILIVGRASDPLGINAFLINKNGVILSEGGVFQFTLRLTKGENQVDIIAINNKGIMNEKKFIIDCTAENAPAAGEDIPEIASSRYYALLIGISEYQNDEIPDLTNPVKDAQSLFDVLVTKYNFEKENIIFLKNPTQKEIFMAFENLGKNLTQNDNLLIFYAGHGSWEPKGKVGYWLPSDATRNSKVYWFSNSNLRDLIAGIDTKHTILIADACFSGAIFQTRSAGTDAPKVIQKLYDLTSRKAMTSGVLEEVPDESQFIKYLVKRLNENEEKYLPSEILFSSFKGSVMSNSPNVPQYGVIQNVGDDGGDFIFVKR